MSTGIDPSELNEEELEQRRQNLKDAVEEETQSLEESEENALDALAEATEDKQETHTVELTGGIEVEVKDELPGTLEKKAATIRSDDVDAAVDTMIEVMTALIQDDDYASRPVWEQYHAEFGTTNLMECAMAVTEPYYERQEELQDQRQFRGER
jgi:hypothetical protein